MVEFTTTIGCYDEPVLVTGCFDEDHGFTPSFVEAWPAPKGVKPTNLLGYLSEDTLKGFAPLAEAALQADYRQHREDMAADTWAAA